MAIFRVSGTLCVHGVEGAWSITVEADDDAAAQQLAFECFAVELQCDVAEIEEIVEAA